MFETKHLTKRYGKRGCCRPTSPMAKADHGITWGPNRCPGGHRGNVVRPDVHPVRIRRRRGLGPAGGARRPARRPGTVRLPDRAGGNARGLRNVGGAGEPSELGGVAA